MSVPAAVLAEVAAALEERWRRPAGRLRADPVGGGCISAAARLETESGERAFLKWAGPGDAPAGLFAAEAAGLEALAGADAIRVPDVLGCHESDGAGVSWLLLEWLEPGPARTGGWAELGDGLARLHRCRGPDWGWDEDNFIGTLPQANGRIAEWPAFWRERRLAPQLRDAERAGYLDVEDRRRMERLLAALDAALAPAAEDGPSLLHGDLWSGNVHFMADGRPALVDPASYHGHREVDLAMSELFGGFDAAFFGAYREVWPLLPGYAETRRPIYQLYYLLVHVNLFGGAYVAGTRRALREVQL